MNLRVKVSQAFSCFVLIGGLTACTDVDFSPASVSNLSVEDLAIEPINPDALPSCSDFIVGPTTGLCLVFKDDFERDNISDDDNFQWSKLFNDSSGTGSDLDTIIRSRDEMGPMRSMAGPPNDEEQRALVFSGRAGGSTHEIYLTSTTLPIDVNIYSWVVVQFYYLPIGLEDSISLSNFSNEKVPETIRLDVCNDTNDMCNSVSNRDSWERHWLGEILDGVFTGFEQGFGLNRRYDNIDNYAITDWKFASFLINLNDYPHLKEDGGSFSFRLSVSLDEGYFSNDKNKKMEDGVLLDNVVVVAASVSQEPEL